jgi:hypothetical protein
MTHLHVVIAKPKLVHHTYYICLRAKHVKIAWCAIYVNLLPYVARKQKN